ncbi:hypothetical protein [Humidisolicoccus flavus]|uniref:hypothetical protein n=1 Tax=Humidisolicoccus flavus TaxID=3111414 RepID=UPI003245C01B
MKLRPVAAIAAAAIVMLGAAGCSLISPQGTTIQYQTGNGASGETGLVLIRNAQLVTDPENSGPTQIIGTFVNNGPATTVQIVGAGDSIDLMVEPGVTRLGGDNQVLIEEVDAVLGSTVPFSFQADGSDAVGIPLQFFSSSHPGYETLEPTPAPIEDDEELEVTQTEAP